MIRFGPGQRRVFAEHVPELANFAAGSFIFGQVLTDRPYSIVVAVIGVAAWLALTGVALFFAKGD